ncbi:AAA family ATPase [Delftia sp. WSY_14]|uniref:AAA family ATPase n=1 Tax=unclassified Delftia TaxID=2613839 RepID=UPI00370AD6D0
MAKKEDWRIFKGTRRPHDGLARLPSPPPWRPRRSVVKQERTWPLGTKDDLLLPPAALQRGRVFHATEHIVDMVNAALYLRRPLLVTGPPGSGKSSLIDAVAYELRMGPPLRWSVTSRSTLRDALYQYDAIGRLQQQEAGVQSGIGDFITLGALGTALLPTSRPRALLIDEIDKSDIDLPNDLLNVFEEGEFEIPELRRLGAGLTSEIFTSDPCQPRARVEGGVISGCEFPLMILTSNGEREFPAPFLRRCLRLRMPNPTGMLPEDDNQDWKRLDAIVDLHFSTDERAKAEAIIGSFKTLATQKREVATDQLLNAIYFVMSSQVGPGKQRDEVVAELMRELVVAGS